MKAWYVADDGSISPCKGSFDAKTGRYAFKTNHFSTYVLVEFPFTDVADSAWYYGNVAYAYMNKLFSGTSETTFQPETVMSRAMLVTVLWRMEKSPEAARASFSDVAADTWYEKAVNWAADKKIVEGSDGKFMPESAITREQLVAIIYRYASFKGYDLSAKAELSAFADSSSVSEYAAAAMQWATGAKLVTGADGKLMPQDSATRAQVTAILQSFFNTYVK